MVQKFLKKLPNFEIEQLEPLQGADLTAYGARSLKLIASWGREVLILPDRTPFGPMYIARLRRK